MMHLALRNLFQNKFRAILSLGGVALALTLIMSLDAIFTGVEKQITAYILKSRADIFLSQSGVLNLHMANSSIPASLEDAAREVDGVQSVTPILYTTNMVVMGEERNLAYIIGLPDTASAGGPWQISEGADLPAQGEVIVDQQLAEKSGLALGSAVEIMGRKFTISGLSEGTRSLTNSVAFISIKDFRDIRRNQDATSFLLIQAQPGQNLDTLGNAIEQAVPGYAIQTREQFAEQERRVVKDMSTDVITIMNLIGFMIGLAVVALSIYTSTYSRRAEYGVLKALGARNSTLYRVVLNQAFLSVLFGLAIALALTYSLSVGITQAGTNLRLEISTASIQKVAIVSIIIAGLSAVIPVRQISGLDPARVFRGK